MPPENADARFQTMTAIRGLLATAGGAPRKRYGQCFLIDRNLMMKLVDSAELKSTDCVLEVGAGTGSLTGLLAERCGRVVSVEVDACVAAIARDQLAGFDNVRLIETDALAHKSEIAPVVLSAIAAAQSEAKGHLKLVANLPYDIATPLVINLLLSSLPISRLCFTVQTEVADRFLAEPNTNDYGPVSILTQLVADGRRICRLPPRAFWPAPKVHSSMLRLEVRSRRPLSHGDLRAFSGFVHDFFKYRRKTLAHTARFLGLDGKLLPALSALNADPKLRPENLGPEQWLAAFHAIR